MCQDQDDSTESNNNFLSKLQRKIFKLCIKRVYLFIENES